MLQIILREKNMGDELLKESVQDAKLLVKTALANASLVLTEAFTPQLQSMLAKKLQAEMDVDDDAEDVDDEDAVDESADSDDEIVDDEDEGSENSEDTNEIKAEDGEVVSEDESSRDDSAVDVNEMDDEDLEDLDGEEEDDDDGLDLDEIIAELEAALTNEDDDEEEFGDDDEVEDDDEVAEDFGAGDDDEAGDDEEDDDELDLDEILRALEEMEQTDEEDSTNEELASLKSRVSELEGSVNEHRDVVVFLRDKLNEVNLLNAKLLYSNKLFRAFNMTNEQKRSVLESLDRTLNTREVKLIYASLAENLSNSTVSNQTRITEGSASKVVTSTKPKKDVIAEEADADVVNTKAAFARLVELAKINQ